jgi:threonine/homoserine/homoserine lactone efflux protein
MALLAPALGLGLAYAATPGVVNTECVRRGLASGFRPAFLVQVGALAGDALWALLALAGIAALSGSDSLEIGLSIVGGVFLCRLAFQALRDAWRGATTKSGLAGLGSMRTGLVFGLANPAGLAFWAGVGGGLLTTRAQSPTLDAYAVFLLAFLTGALCWSVGISAFVSWGRRYARPRVFRFVDAVCGAALGYFGVRMLWTGLRRMREVAVVGRLIVP